MKIFALLKEVFAFLRSTKKWWLAPVLIVLVFLAGMLFFASGSVIAPFIYTMF